MNEEKRQKAFFIWVERWDTTHHFLMWLNPQVPGYFRMIAIDAHQIAFASVAWVSREAGSMNLGRSQVC